jgi:DNA repair exonuclease SbcCD nuclease subunit
VKFLLISDIHLSEKPPSSCTDSYVDDLFELLHQAREVGRERHVDAMVWAGDTFHSKAASRVSHRLVQRVAEYVNVTPFPVLILAGNHDMSNDRYDSLYKTQPLGMLWRAGAVELRGWAEVARGVPLPVYGVPWLQGYGNYGEQCAEGVTPEIAGRVSDVLDDYRKQVYEAGWGKHKPLVVAHAPLYPPGEELAYEWFPGDAWALAMGGSGNVFYGHVHEPHRAFRHRYVVFCNNGALSRGSLHEYNLTRQVGVTLYDTDEGTFEFIPLDAKPASEVFRLTEKQEATDLQGRLDSFLEGVGAASIEVVSVEGVIAHIRTLGLSEEVVSLAEELLTEAQHASKHGAGPVA